MPRRFDLHFQALTEEEQKNTFKFLTFGKPQAVGVKGLHMLVNHWVKCFLTPKGSDPSSLGYGTEFTRLIGSSVSVHDARDVCLIAIENCNDQMAAMQTSDTTLTPSERLGTARLLRFVPDNASPGFALYVEIKNQANERLILQLPGALSNGD